MAHSRAVFYVSDGTALTAEALGAAVLSQYPIEWKRHVFPFVDTPARAAEVRALIDRLAAADAARPVVLYSIVSDEIRAEIAHCNGFCQDVLEALVRPLERELGVIPEGRLGRTHGLVGENAARYDARIAAIDYTLSHDDGASFKDIERADIILLGVSRCGKTPASLFLAMQFGLATLNYPFVSDDLDDLAIPAAIVPFKSRIFGLTIAPRRLAAIREQRLADSQYASLRQCQREVSAVERLYQRHGIPNLDTSSLSVEEIATSVINRLGIERRSF